MTVAQLQEYAESLRNRPRVPLIITNEWVEANRQEAIRIGLIDQDGNPLDNRFIKD